MIGFDDEMAGQAFATVPPLLCGTVGRRNASSRPTRTQETSAHSSGGE
ncbi:hypothetical protein FTUN_4995 [Frigoriglobus tundricola]|uniref:Uncharacterized protein n=1 Tax=Frigoriglobus tundricola TaxID=2774151 RepID=A0A6M5YVU5_9BACT|nr:hypothetical protein FTUN_4995 [Frigoriglobus tundricola]